MLLPAALLADLRQGAFAPSALPPRIGAEAEMLALDSETRLPVPITAEHGRATLPLLRRLAAEGGWTERPTAYGAPHWQIPGRGSISHEPGGQLEFSADPHGSVTTLLDTLRAVLLPLGAAAADAGIELLSVGIDPHNPVERVPLELTGARYARMAEHFARIGPAGARMMRRTASFQVNLDWGPPEEAWLRWRVLNAAAPYVTAIFANSSVYAGRATGHRSFRAAQWRQLDPQRTGIFFCGPDAPAEYRDWALDAPAILLDGDAPFGERMRDPTVGLPEWQAHLSTLFPEVRPKGFLEVRSLDAVPPAWYAAPLALLSGLVYDPASLRAATELLGTPSPAKLVRAGEAGLADPALARGARELWDLGLAGCERLGTGWISGAALQEAREFAEVYTRRGRSPADDAASGETVSASATSLP